MTLAWLSYIRVFTFGKNQEHLSELKTVFENLEEVTTTKTGSKPKSAKRKLDGWDTIYRRTEYERTQKKTRTIEKLLALKMQTTLILFLEMFHSSKNSKQTCPDTGLRELKKEYG